MADDVTLEVGQSNVTIDLGNEYIGSAYSPVVEVTDTEEGHTISITSADPNAAGHLVTHIIEVPTYSEEEEGREAAEAARQAAEAARQAQEAQRQAAESARSAAESERAAEEQERADAEDARAAAETARQTAETARQQAEQARQTAETARQQAEASRAAAETAREQAEQARESATAAAVRAAETATAAANDAASDATAAAGTATDAAAAATTAAQQATTAAGSANDAAAAATTAAGTANTAAAAADTAREGIQDDLAQMRSDIADKAFVDAYVPLLIAGAALGITGNDAEESAWLARTSEADGVASVKSIHGRTLRWNQLVGEPVSYGSTTASGLTVTTAENGVFIVDGTCTSPVWLASIRARPIGSLVSGHKYIISAKGDIASFSQLGTSLQGYPTGGKNYVMFTASRDYKAALLQAYIPEGTYSNAKFIAQCFDLTAMLGAGSEPSTIEEFTALYPLPYYPYDTGSLLPVQMEGIESTGFNQWNEEWRLGNYDTNNGTFYAENTHLACKNPIPVFPNTDYYYNTNGANINVCYLDADKAYIGSFNSAHDVVRTTPANCRYIVFNMATSYGTTYKGDICINLSDPTRNGTYEPYWQQERSIPAGTLRSAGTVYDELTETERITRVGERAYQSGDESDATVVTDGTITHYPLATPTTTPIDPPLNMTYRTEQGGTERIVVPTGELSAPPTIVAAQGYTAESLRDVALATIAPVENGLASTNYAVGSYLVHGGKLCRVTTAIATGESISIGTNVTATTVMAEILSLVQ